MPENPEPTVEFDAPLPALAEACEAFLRVWRDDHAEAHMLPIRRLSDALARVISPRSGNSDD